MPLPHRFRDPALLQLALTHASTGKSEDNERLEFLGDAVLDLIVAEEFYDRTPPHSEGEMTELKALGFARDAGTVSAAALQTQNYLAVRYRWVNRMGASDARGAGCEAGTH